MTINKILTMYVRIYLMHVLIFAINALIIFSTTYSQESCNTEHTSTSGNISSPGYPVNYPNNIFCTWTITAPPGRVINMEILFIQLDNEPGCNDYLQILDGSINLPEHRIYYRCGSSVTLQNNILSTTNSMTVIFESDELNSGIGFVAHYEQSLYREEFILVADHTSGGILVLDVLQESSRLITQPVDGEHLVGQLDFDPIERQIYFVDNDPHQIKRFFMDRTQESNEEVIVENIGDVGGLAINYVSRNLYFATAEHILVSGLDGRFRYKIGDGSRRSKDLAVDYISSFVFWVAGDSKARVVRCDGDGRNMFNNFIENGLGDPTGLTINYESDGTFLYICDNLLSTITRINIDGTARETLTTFPGAVRFPIDLALDWVGNLYWTETDGEGLDFLSKDRLLYGEFSVYAEGRLLMAMIVYSSARNTGSPDGHCTNNGRPCPQLCLPSTSPTSSCKEVLPTVSHCPPDIISTTTTVIYWSEPIAFSLLHKSLTARKSHQPGSIFELGTTIVWYNFTDEFGNTERCNFTVTVTGEVTSRSPPVTSEGTSKRQLLTIMIPISIALALIVISVIITCIYKQWKRDTNIPTSTLQPSAPVLFHSNEDQRNIHGHENNIANLQLPQNMNQNHLYIFNNENGHFNN